MRRVLLLPLLGMVVLTAAGCFSYPPQGGLRSDFDYTRQERPPAEQPESTATPATAATATRRGASGDPMGAARVDGQPPAAPADHTGMWVLRRFGSEPGWLEGYPELIHAGYDWQTYFTARLREALRRRVGNVHTVNRELTPEQVEMLVDQGLRYLLAGELGRVHLAPDAADNDALFIEATYLLRAQRQNRLRLVQKERLAATEAIGDTLDSGDLDRLLVGLAETLADRVAVRTAADVLAVRH